MNYLKYADPNDPNSSYPEYEVKFYLHNEGVNGDTISWDITRVRIREFDPNGAVVDEWNDNDPAMPGGGTWNVRHGDVSDPQSSEFTLPPHMIGTATADDPNTDDMDYDVEGSPPGPTSPFSPAAWLDYSLTVGTNVVASGEDEPTKAGPVGDPPA